MWRLAAGLGAFALAGLLIILFGNSRYHSGQLAESAIWQAKTALATLDDTRHANAVETAQTTATQESTDDLKAKLADALALAAARPRRVCHGAQTSGGVQSVPEPANASSAADNSDEISKLDDAACAENTVKAQGWLAWWTKEAVIPR